MPAKSTKQARARIFLVDDHPLLRKGLADYISDEPDMIVCGQAGTAREALAGIEQTKPAVAIVDISIPGRDGFELIKDIKARCHGTQVLVLSMHDESLYADRALRAGARGYVMKSAPAEEFIDAIRKVLRGEVVVGKRAMSRFLQQMTHVNASPGTSALEQLSDRELQVLRLIGEGCSRKQIATELNLSVKTIETHRANIRQKLGLTNANDLLYHAIEFVREETSRSGR